VARYFRRNKEKIVFAPAVANLAAPSRVEISAGTILNQPNDTAFAGIQGMTGFAFSNNPIATPDAGSDFDKQIPGIDTMDNSSMTIYDDDASATKRTALAKGTAGVIIRMPYGDTVGKRCECWPVRSAGVNDDVDIAGSGSAATFVVGFAIENKPNQNAVVPA
jgi:hypothetical protein